MKQILRSEIAQERCNQQALGAYNASVGSSTDISGISVGDVFNSISGISTNISSISSIGDYASEINQQVSQSEVNNIKQYLSKDSLAYKILDDDKNYSLKKGYQFTDKQKWVIAYELKKSNKYLEHVKTQQAQSQQKAKIQFAKAQESKNKLKSNKDNAKQHTDRIKSSGRKLGDYYKWLNTKGNPYRKEAFNKKYSADSVSAFLTK